MSIELQKRIPAGKGYIGPEPAGCFNSGVAPTIIHSKRLRHYHSHFRFAVGPENYVKPAINFMLWRMSDRYESQKFSITKTRAIPLHGDAKKPYKNDRLTVYFYKTYKAARNKWEAMCRGMIQENREIAQNVDKLNKVIKTSKDVNEVCSAVLKLSDYI